MQNGSISIGSALSFSPITIGFIILLLDGYILWGRGPTIIGSLLMVWIGCGPTRLYTHMFILHYPGAYGCGMIVRELNLNGFTILKSKHGLVLILRARRNDFFRNKIIIVLDV